MSWNELSMTDRAQYIKLGLDNGITDLNVIRDTYNKYAEGGPIKSSKEYKKVLSNYWHEDVDKHDYDYDKYYNDNPNEALKQLNMILSGGHGHFPDGGKSGTYKKPSHPTYPELGEKSWSNDDTVFHMGKNQAFGNTDRILDYLGSDLNYNKGATKVMYEDAYQLPSITVTPRGNYTDLSPNKLGTGWVYSDRKDVADRNFINKFAEGGDLNDSEDDLSRMNGTITETPPLLDRIWYKTKDIGDALLNFIPGYDFISDAISGNKEQAISESGETAAIASNQLGKLGNYKYNNSRNVPIPHKLGKVRNAFVHNANRSTYKLIGKTAPKVAKFLGPVGTVVGIPALVSDIENLKRALGFRYNQSLIMQ